MRITFSSGLRAAARRRETHRGRVHAWAEAHFEVGCLRKRDLGGIVAKHRESRYTAAEENPTWIKARKSTYSQLAGRDELFERSYEAAGAREIRWGYVRGACGTQTTPGTHRVDVNGTAV